MKWLVDNNVLFAALDASHIGHAACRAWLDKAKPEGWGVTVETFLGVIRKLMNPVIMNGRPLKAAAAVGAVRQELSGPHAGAIITGVAPSDAFLKKAQGHRQIMDFYLATVAFETGAKLVTNDHGILTAFPGLSTRPV
jgi:predicted nucleic acid-binding protein